MKLLNFGKPKRGKRGVLMAYPSLNGYSRTEQILEAQRAGFDMTLPGFPWLIEPYGLLHVSPVSEARNQCVDRFYNHTAHEFLYFVDHDMIPPDNWHDLLGHGDIVSGITFMWDARREPEKRLLFNQFKLNEDGVSESVAPRYYDKPYEVDIVGTACMVISRRVFDKLGPRPFTDIKASDGHRLIGEDMDFCRKARAAGFKVIIRPNVIFNHYKEVGLREVHETLAALTKVASQAGYEAGFKEGAARAMQHVKEHGLPQEEQPGLAGAVAQAAGGAA
jgi:hypothetical protein